MKKYLNNNKKGLILVMCGFIILSIMIYSNIKTKEAILKEERSKQHLTVSINEPISKRILTEDQIVDMYLNDHIETLEFYAKTFLIDKVVLINSLKNNYVEMDLLNQTNFDYFLIEYLFNLENTNKELFTKTIIPCVDSKEYIVSLIKYYTSIYPNVDFTIVASIAQVESGYSAPGMLKYNNIYGGMSGRGLIRYKTIEYGVLRYIKLLNDGYFSQGLNTIDAIGKIFNPIYNEFGVKIARPIWVTNVTNALGEFSAHDEVNISILNTLKHNN